MKKTHLPAVCLLAALLASVPSTRAQYYKKSPQDILREAQERQRAIDKIGEDFRKNATDILEREQRRAQEEREERRRQQDQDREDRAAERQRREEEQRQEDLKRSIQQTQESQRQEQQTISTILQNGQPTAAQPSYQSTPSATSQPLNGYQASSTRRQEPAEVSRSTTPEKPKPCALGGNPNDQGMVRDGWSRWQSLADNIWVSYTKVQNKFENGQPLWTWSLRNWNDRAVKTVWFEYYEKGGWHKDLTPFTLNPRASHGGWGSFTAVGETPPILRITEVDFK